MNKKHKLCDDKTGHYLAKKKEKKLKSYSKISTKVIGAGRKKKKKEVQIWKFKLFWSSNLDILNYVKIEKKDAEWKKRLSHKKKKIAFLILNDKSSV